jgi:hypothetical protein
MKRRVFQSRGKWFADFGAAVGPEACNLLECDSWEAAFWWAMVYEGPGEVV